MQNGYAVDLFGPPQLTSLFARDRPPCQRRAKEARTRPPSSSMMRRSLRSGFSSGISSTRRSVCRRRSLRQVRQLWLEWPGKIQSPASPAPEKVKTKAELQAYGYSRRPQSAHIQRAIDERLSRSVPPLHPQINLASHIIAHSPSFLVPRIFAGAISAASLWPSGAEDGRSPAAFGTARRGRLRRVCRFRRPESAADGASLER